jgi:hypothetical protein
MIDFTANELWFELQCQKCFQINKYLLHHVAKIVDIPGKHIDLILQETTSTFQQLAGIRASTTINSIKLVIV